MTLTRSLLAKAFPDDPRLRSELENAGDAIDSAQAQLDSLIASATDLQAKLQALQDAATQPHSALLDAISGVPDGDLGVFEKVGAAQVILHEVNSGDDAALVTRQYLMSYVGTGPTTARPTLSAQRRAVYFDTTLAPSGKPVFWTGVHWVDATGTLV